MTDLHGRCATHGLYGLDCAAFDRLRARAHDCCEICAVPAIETEHGLLHIDHAGPYSAKARVRGLLCSRCNTWLGRCEGNLWKRDRHLGLTPLQRAYLAHPFWREPDYDGMAAARAAERARFQAAAEVLRAGFCPRPRNPLESAISDAAVATAVRHGMRCREVAAVLGVDTARVSHIDRRHRAAD